MNWWKNLSVPIRRNVVLAPYTTFRIGGKAAFFAEPASLEDLKLLLREAKRYTIPVLVLGAGSNLLVADKGVDALVVRLGTPYFTRLTRSGKELYAGAGLPLAQLVRYCQTQGLLGAEFLAGIPGTVGGALVMNAGAWGSEISEIVRSVSVISRRGTVRSILRKDIRCGYRSSGLASSIVVGARFQLTPGSRAKGKARVASYLRKRGASQDLTGRSAGCCFKNPRGRAAGMLIDACGLKGARVGDAQVSLRHANFIINRGHASAREVRTVMKRMQQAVAKKFRIQLEPEIRMWG